MYSPKTKLRKAVSEKEHQRRAHHVQKKTTPLSDYDRAKLKTHTLFLTLAKWLITQLLRDHASIINNQNPFILLFNFTVDSLPRSDLLIGTRLDMLLVKLNGTIFFQASVHMHGFTRTAAASTLKLDPAHEVFIHDPQSHMVGATLHLSCDLSQINYVAQNISLQSALNDEPTTFTILPQFHLPNITHNDLK